MWDFGFEDGFYVGAQDFGSHDQGVAACEQEVCNFGVFLKVSDEEVYFAHCEFQFFNADELGPAKAE